MDPRQLENIAHVVLRMVHPEPHVEWLKPIPGGGDDWEWTRKEWEKWQFPTRTEAEEYAKRYHAIAAPCAMPEEKPADDSAHKPSTPKSRKRKRKKRRQDSGNEAPNHVHYSTEQYIEDLERRHLF